MRIEVIAKTDEPKKVKGDLLERITGELLEIQGYEVETQVRMGRRDDTRRHA